MPKSAAAVIAQNKARIDFIKENPKLTIRQIARALKIGYVKAWRLVHGYQGRRKVDKNRLPYKKERSEKNRIVTKTSQKMFNLKERGDWMV